MRKQKEAEEKSKFASQRSKWKEQLNYEKSRDTEGPVKSAEGMIARYKAELAELEASAVNAMKELDESKNKLRGDGKRASTSQGASQGARK